MQTSKNSTPSVRVSTVPQAPQLPGSLTPGTAGCGSWGRPPPPSGAQLPAGLLTCSLPQKHRTPTLPFSLEFQRKKSQHGPSGAHTQPAGTAAGNAQQGQCHQSSPSRRHTPATSRHGHRASQQADEWREWLGKSEEPGDSLHCLEVPPRPLFSYLLIFIVANISKIYHFNRFWFFWPHHTACGILIPQPGVEPEPLAVTAWSPNQWTTREFPNHF